MPKHLNINYHVDMADGTSWDVTADQRDWAKMEAQSFPPTAYMNSARFMAWSASSREKLTRLSWTRFNEEACLDVQDVTPRPADDEDTEDEESLDPGRTTTSGTA